jgi:hypothetical protein
MLVVDFCESIRSDSVVKHFNILPFVTASTDSIVNLKRRSKRPLSHILSYVMKHTFNSDYSDSVTASAETVSELIDLPVCLHGESFRYTLIHHAELQLMQIRQWGLMYSNNLWQDSWQPSSIHICPVYSATNLIWYLITKSSTQHNISIRRLLDHPPYQFINVLNIWIYQK